MNFLKNVINGILVTLISTGLITLGNYFFNLNLSKLEIFLIFILVVIITILACFIMKNKKISIKYKKEIIELDFELFNYENKLKNIETKINTNPDNTKKQLDKLMDDYATSLSKIITLLYSENKRVDVTIREIKEIDNKQKVIPRGIPTDMETERIDFFKTGEASKGRIAGPENSDYAFIDSKDDNNFYEPDITKISNYKSEHAQYYKEKNYYKGKIVYPITGDNTKIRGYNPKKWNGGILGVLVGDTKDTKVFTYENKEHYLAIFKLYAQKLSQFLDLYKQCSKKIEEKNSNDKGGNNK